MQATRLDMYGHAEGIEADLRGMYLLDALFEAGPTEFASGEEKPISWGELVSYADATGQISEPWEFRAVMGMSRAYFRAKVRGKDVHAIPPVELEE